MTTRGPRGASLATTALLLLLAVVGSLCAVLPSATAEPAPDLKALKADVERTADRLAALTVEWEKGQQTLGELVTRKMLSKRAAEEDLEKQTVVAQQRVANLAASMYRNPVDPMITAVLTGEPYAIADMRVLRSTLGQTRTAQQKAIELLNTHVAQAQALVQEQDDAASLAIRLQAKLNDDMAQLQADAAASLIRLEAGFAEVRRRAAAAAAAAAAARGQMNAERLARLAAAGALGGSGTPCSGGIPADVINGFLPESALCPLNNAPGHRLVAGAAAAFNRMSAAYAETFGTPLCVTDSYRDYAGQVAVFRSKPNLAATPGRSNHGWGVAIDFCGGIQGFGTPAHEWMRENAGAFGWVHPGWAQQGGSKPEAWHWEYAG